jgi:hypothetical protein
MKHCIGTVMQGFITIALIAALSLPATAAEPSLAARLFEASPTALALAAGGFTTPGNQAAAGESSEDEIDPSTLQTGRALMLSAIMPGTGEYYSGHRLRAAAFFTVEVAAWVAVISFYNQGMDKDRKFKKYADQHFFEEIYRGYEYELARNQNYGDSGAYLGTEPQWREEEWETKIHYLPDVGFTHELPTGEDRHSNRSQDQQYYEMIGKYIHQFGFGWDDVFLPGGGFNGTDDPGTPSYDDLFGGSKRSKDYMDMRYDSNQLLKRSSIAMQIVMLNHVASALHASFTVRNMKRKATGQIGFRSIDYDGRKVAVGGLNLSW